MNNEQASSSFQLLRTLGGSGHKDLIREIAWSPDGKTLASSSLDRTICLWNRKNGVLIRTLAGHRGHVYSVTWSPDGQMIASGSSDKTIRIWNEHNGNLVNTLKGHYGHVFSVAWSPDGRMLASGSADKTINLYDLTQPKPLQTLTGPRDTVFSVSWSPDGKYLAASSRDKSIRIWVAGTGELFRKFEGHNGPVLNIAWSSDSLMLASVSVDKTVRLWDIKTGQTKRVLEGHTDRIICVSFSYDGHLLATKSADGTVWVWRLDNHQPIKGLDKPSGTTGGLGGLAFHPEEHILAMRDDKNHSIKIWSLDYDALFDPGTKSNIRHYANAKVVLMGDSGVGKSGLGLVLTGKPYKPTESTHGRNVWVFDTHNISQQKGQREMRETLLWDLAGQPSYRLIHQLHLNEVAVALVVFDARCETEPFSGVQHWARALRQVHRLQENKSAPIKKYLVAARTDVSGIAVSPERIETIKRDLGFDDYFETSAKEGWQIKELIQTIKDSIDWDSIPKVSSNLLFQTIKKFLLDEKKARRFLSPVNDLYRLFCQANEDLKDNQELFDMFNTCIERVENRGLIRYLSFGGYILLQPELLDSYASAMINSARKEPDGMGSIAEEDALNGRFTMPEEKRIPDKNEEKLLLIATVEELLRHEIAFRQSTEQNMKLVFPSQLTREWPDAMDIPGKSVVFTFEGPVMNIYSTLVVRLSHGSIFNLKKIWRNAVTFNATVGGLCGISLRELSDGEGELTVFFDEETTKETRFQFENYVAAHLEHQALPSSIHRHQILICPKCDEAIPDRHIEKRKSRGFKTINCSVCDNKISLVDEIEIGAEKTNFGLDSVEDIDRAADDRRELDTAATILKGKVETKAYDVFLCYNSQDKENVKNIGIRLKKEGILPWFDEWEIKPGTDWEEVLEKQIERINSVAVFTGPDGMGPWQEREIRAFIQEFVERRCPVIPVVLPGLEGKPKLPTFLKALQFVDFRNLHPDPFEQLIWGITGKKGEPV